MRTIICVLFTLFLTCQTLADEPRIVALADLLEPRERVFMDNVFPLVDVDAVVLVTVPEDGPGGIIAYVDLIEESPSIIVWLDEADFARVPLVRGILQHPVVCQIILHEMIHVDQTHRGLEFRQQMIRNCRAAAYRDRFFEREAYAVSAILLGKWPVLW